VTVGLFLAEKPPAWYFYECEKTNGNEHPEKIERTMKTRQGERS